MPAILNTVVWPLILVLKSHTNGLLLNYRNQERSKFYAAQRHAALHKRLV